MSDSSKTKVQAASLLLPEGEIAETVFIDSNTLFLVWREGQILSLDEVEVSDILYLPLTKNNKLLRHGVMLLAGGADNFASDDELIAEIRNYLHRYVDLSSDFEIIASYYALLTWVYDAFNEVPYLRFQGDFGSGKSRALLVLGAICYKAVFASGASTISPIFHILDSYRGTLIFDETDFRYSDERADIVKILNNGNVKGFPVLRTMVSNRKEFEPQAFDVYGPKIVAMREAFDDEALESRFLTERMGHRSLRDDIPINLNSAYQEEAEALRNKLLMYRFRRRYSTKLRAWQEGDDTSARTRQILRPLLAVIENEEHRVRVLAYLNREQAVRATKNKASVESLVLGVLLELLNANNADTLPLSSVVRQMIEDYGDDISRPLTSRFVGSIVRRLGVSTYKSRGVFVIPCSELYKIKALSASSDQPPLPKSTGEPSFTLDSNAKAVS